MAEQYTRANPAQVMTQCRAKLSAFLKAQLEALMSSVDDTLFDLSDKAGSGGEQNIYFDAMRILRLNRADIIGEVVVQATQATDALMHRKPAFMTTGAAEIDELEMGLVEHDDLERDLAIDDMVIKTHRAHENALFLIHRRLENLFGIEELKPEDNPFDPLPIARAYKSAIAAQDIGIKVELILYKLFDKRVLGAFAQLYGEINACLVQNAILPDLKPPKLEAVTNPSTPSTQDSSLSSLLDAMSAGEAPPAGEEGGGLMSVLSQLIAAQGGGGGGAGAGGGGGGGAGVMVAPVLAGGGDVVTALNKLQHVAPQADGTIDWSQLKLQIVGDVKERVGDDVSGIGRVEESTIDLVSMLFDFVFDDDALPDQVKVCIGRLQIPILKLALLDKSFFSRKNHPARRLLNELSRAGLGWSEEEEAQSDNLLGKISTLVGRVLEDFDEDPEIFNEVLEEFVTYTDQERRRAEEKEAKSARDAQDRERVKIARVVAEESIKRIIGSAALPEDFIRFLNSVWRDFLVKVYYAKGSDSKLWEKALNIAAMLVWTLTPKHSSAEREHLIEILPSLLKSVREGMRYMSRSESEQESLLSRLAIEHARMVQHSEADRPPPTSPRVTAAEPPPRRSEVEAEGEDDTGTYVTIPLEAAMPGDEGTEEIVDIDGRSFMARKVGEINRMLVEGKFQVYAEVEIERARALIALESTDDTLLQQVRNLPDGTWMEFVINEEETLRAKLSWKSLISGKYFFVNRRGLKVREMVLEELAAMILAGHARLIDDSPVLDRAIESLVSSMGPESQTVH